MKKRLDCMEEGFTDTESMWMKIEDQRGEKEYTMVKKREVPTTQSAKSVTGDAIELPKFIKKKAL